VKKVAVADAVGVPVTGPAVKASPPRKRRTIGNATRLFAATVLLPTALAGGYYGFVAADVYTSESRFVLRSPQRQVPTGLGAILQSAGFTRAQDDTYTIHDFMLSRDAVRLLDNELQLKQRFADPRIDLPNRFAAVYGDDSLEALHLYFQKRVRVEPNPISAISTVRVNAFDPQTARAINERLLQMSEALVNKLNERGRQDLIRFAEREVAAAENRAKAATLAVSEFRNQRSVFDPGRQSAIQLQLVSKLQDELIAIRN